MTFKFLKPNYAADDAGGDAAAAAAKAAADAAAAAAAGKPWHDGMDAELLGRMQIKGWDKMTAGEAALAAVTAHRDAEKYIGMPADRIAKLPKDAEDVETANALWTKLGKPVDAAGYKFDDVKKADGTPADPAFLDAVRASAFAANLPVAAAARVAQDVLKFQESAAATKATEDAGKLEDAKKALATNWGANFEANKFIASQAAAKLGVGPDQVAALEKVAGYDKVMEMFRLIGTKIGEDKFVANLSPNQGGVMTREQAVARKAELMQDQAWAKRYMEGGSQEMREMTALITLIQSE